MDNNELNKNQIFGGQEEGKSRRFPDTTPEYQPTGRREEDQKKTMYLKEDV